MDEQEQQAQREAAEREDDEAAWLETLDADEQAPQTAVIAGEDRAVAIELEMEAEYQEGGQEGTKTHQVEWWTADSVASSVTTTSVRLRVHRGSVR